MCVCERERERVVWGGGEVRAYLPAWMGACVLESERARDGERNSYRKRHTHTQRDTEGEGRGRD